MGGAKINSALILLLFSSLTAVSLWKSFPDKNKQGNTIAKEHQVMTDAGEGEGEDSQTKTTISPEVSKCDEDDMASLRLPGEVTPTSYRIRMVPILEKDFSFTGDVSIVVRANLASNVITMHSYDLVITDYKVQMGDGSSDVNLIRSIKFDDGKDFFIMKLKETLAVGKMYTISMKFRGNLNEYHSGFYKLAYKDPDGSQQWMAYSYFMPTSARRAFPCFDEPHLKATFAVSIARKTDMTSLSNMDLSGPPESDENLPEGYVWDHYNETPKMSTYLVAFVVSKFKSKKAEGKEIRMWAREGFIEDFELGLSDGIKVLDALETFTQTKLELNKMDIIAIPDYYFSGIGNFGLLQCKELDVLYRKGVTSTADMQGVALYIAHDLSHQWFGYLVTPDWWIYIWLNEGFATYLTYTAAAMNEPNWRMMDQFVVFIEQCAFHQDSLESSQPMTKKNSIYPGEADGITYNKGGSLMRMMEHFLTRNTFREGLRAYLSARRYNTSNEEEFFDIMDKQAKADGVLQGDLNVRDIMESWTRKAGFPILTVERNYEDGSTTLTQEKFVLNRKNVNNGGTWWVPITFTTKESPDFERTSPSQWMSTKQTSLTLNKKIPTNAWAIFNVQETGFYRVNYDERNWLMITEYLKTDDYHKVHPINRAQLIDDSFNLARNGYLDYSLALDLGTYLIRETDYIPWYSAFEAFEYLNIHLAASEEYPKFKSYVLHLINTYYETVNIEDTPDDDHLKRLSRSKVTVWACRYNHENCRETATKLFKQWMETKINTIPVDSRKAVYCTAISEGGEEEWNFLWNEFVSATLWAEQTVLLDALACSKNKELLKRFLLQSINEELNLSARVRAQFLSSLIQTTEGRDVALDFPFSKLMGSIFGYPVDVSGLTEKISSKAQVEKMKRKLIIEFGMRTSTLITDETQNLDDNVAWREKNVPIIESWLKRNVKTNKA